MISSAVLWIMLTTVFIRPLTADVVLLTDGRRFEGTILHEDIEGVTIDTMVGNIRVRVFHIDDDEIKSVEKKPLPDGFYDPPPAKARASDPKRFDPDANLYLEIPIVGEIGKDVFAEGVRRAMTYAKRQRIRHLVFHIDSSGGNLDEAIAIWELMSRFHHDFEYHVVVRKCIGDTVVIAMGCDTFTIMDGAIVGGSDQDLGETEEWTAEDEQVLRAYLAEEAAAYVESMHRFERALLVRAVIDPAQRLSAWFDPTGQTIQLGPSVPPGISSEQIIFQNPDNEALVLRYHQLVEMGLPQLRGSVADLGQILGLDHWQAESDFGIRTIKSVAQSHQRREAAQSRAFELKVQRNIQRRQKMVEVIEHNIYLASQSDPMQGNYDVYSTRYRTRRIGRFGSEKTWKSSSSGAFKSQAKREWKERSDITMRYLRKVAQAARSMQRLDREAEKLGLEPTYQPGELDQMIQDMDAKFQAIQRNRNVDRPPG